MRIAFLILLNKKPYHGYEMMKEVRDRTEGFWNPTAGGVYPILQSLEKSGYIKGEWSSQKRKRKTYHITESGKLILEKALLKHNQITESMNNLFKEYSKDVLGLELKSLVMPKIPNPFSPFLEKKTKNTIDSLKIKKEQIQQRIKFLQKEQQKVDKRLLKLKNRINSDVMENKKNSHDAKENSN
jgi:DNA-binding PadR family transcriptional regulator